MVPRVAGRQIRWSVRAAGLKWRLAVPPEEVEKRLRSALSGSPDRPAVSSVAITADPIYGSESRGSFHVCPVYRPRSRYHTSARIRVSGEGSQTEIRASFGFGAVRGALLCLAPGVLGVALSLSNPAELSAAGPIFATPAVLGGLYLAYGGYRDRRAIITALQVLFPEAVLAA